MTSDCSMSTAAMKLQHTARRAPIVHGLVTGLGYSCSDCSNACNMNSAATRLLHFGCGAPTVPRLVTRLGYGCRVQQTAECSTVSAANVSWLQHPGYSKRAVGEGGRPPKPHQWPRDEAAAARTPAGGRPPCGPATRDPAWGGTRPLASRS